MLTLDNYSYVLFGYGLTQRAIANSLYLALVGATIGVVLAVLHGYFLNRGPVRWRGIADVVLSLPLGIPGIILGLGYLILALRTRFIRR
jgi:iron(III) transport system permease protein